MPKLKLSTLVPTSPEALFEYITDYPARGDAEQQVLEERYGQLLERTGQLYKFQETSEDQTVWECSFTPPHHRSMRAIDSNWSDRFDQFEAVPEGTRWTVTWESKAHGIRACTHWLAFQLRGKRRIYQRVVVPVIERFRNKSTENPPSFY